jgi:hypothetical protein
MTRAMTNEKSPPSPLSEPLSDTRLAEIRATLSHANGISETATRLVSDWPIIRFGAQVEQAALDLLAEVERLRAERAVLSA